MINCISISDGTEQNSFIAPRIVEIFTSGFQDAGLGTVGSLLLLLLLLLLLNPKSNEFREANTALTGKGV